MFPDPSRPRRIRTGLLFVLALLLHHFPDLYQLPGLQAVVGGRVFLPGLSSRQRLVLAKIRHITIQILDGGHDRFLTDRFFNTLC